MHKIEQIESFGAFLDFLANPDEYRQLVKDVRTAAKDYRELVEKKRKIKDIDAWRASEGVRISQQYEELDRKNEAHYKAVADLAAKKESHKKSVSDANKELQDKSEELSKREQTVSELEKQKAKLDKLEGEYKNKLANLKAEKDRLKQQAEQIKAAAGGL